MALPKKISATEAARSFSDVVSRVHYRGEEFVVEKGGEAMCKISPVGQGATKSTIADLLAVLADAPAPDQGFRDLVLEVARRQPKAPKSPWE